MEYFEEILTKKRKLLTKNKSVLASLGLRIRYFTKKVLFIEKFFELGEFLGVV